MSVHKPRVRAAAKRRVATARVEAASGSAPRETGRRDMGSDAWWRTLLHRKRAVGSLYGISPIARVKLVREGLPAEAVGIIAMDMGITKEKLYATLGMPRATIERKARRGQRLSPDEAERVIGIARLIGQVEQIVRESGDADRFDAAGWVAAWLDRPLPALAGSRPATLMDTAEGREIVANLVAQMQSGAYA